MIRSQVKYRGVAVRFLLETGRLRLPAVTCAKLSTLAAPYLAARETGGCSRVESCVSAASQECLHRVTTDHQQPPPLVGVQDFSGGGRSAEQVESWQSQRLCSGGVESAVSGGRLVAGRVSERRKSAQAGARSRRTCRAVT